MSAFNPDAYFSGQINAHCALPNIEKQDAFDLYYAANELVGALATFRRLVPKYGMAELGRLVRSVGRASGVGDLAAGVVRFVGNVGQLHAKVS